MRTIHDNVSNDFRAVLVRVGTSSKGFFGCYWHQNGSENHFMHLMKIMLKKVPLDNQFIFDLALDPSVYNSKEVCPETNGYYYVDKFLIQIDSLL